MKIKRIKADWASVSIAKDGNVIICAKLNGTAHCVQFESLERLKQAIDAKDVSIKKWAIAVPRNLCILRQLTLPASDLNEALTMIEFELPSIIPLPMDEIVYGSILLNKQEGMLNVLVFVLKLNTLNEYLIPYRNVGIEPLRITLDSLAVQNWFNNVNKSKYEALINAFIDNEYCFIQTSIEGNLQKSIDLTLNNNNKKLFVHEIVREISHQREDLATRIKSNIGYFIAVPEKSLVEMKNLLSSVKHDPVINDATFVQIPNILYYNIDTKSDDRNNEFNYETIVTTGLLDLVVNFKLQHSNLLPQKYLKRHKQKVLLFNYLLTGVLASFFILLIWLCLVTSNRRIKIKSRIIESQIAPIEHVASAVSSKHQRVRAIQGQLSNRGQITEIFKELFEYTPETISISNLKFVSKHDGISVDIKGQADTLPTALDYTYIVRDAKLLSDMQFEDAQQGSRPGGSVTVFKAYCNIKNE